MIKTTLTALVVLSAVLSVTSSKKKPLEYSNTPANLNTDEEVRAKFDKDSIKFDGQITAIRSSWASRNKDQFPEITDTSQKLIQINWWNYEEMIVDPANGEFISDKPWFLIFMHANSYESNLNIEPMQHLAAHFEGRVQFAYVSVPMEEELSYAFEVWEWPRSFYIDEMGLAHAYPYGLISLNKARDWIENRDFKKSPQIFKAPKRCNKYTLIWGYAKKDIRTWYVKNWQPTIELYLRKTGFTYVYDADPTDFDNLKLNQKTNRQIIFIAAGFVWVLELIWDLIVSQTCPAKKEKPKSILNRKVADKSKKEDDKPKSKVDQDQINQVIPDSQLKID